MSFDTYVGIIFSIAVAVGVAFISTFWETKLSKNKSEKSEQNKVGHKSKGKIIYFNEREPIPQEK